MLHFLHHYTTLWYNRVVPLKKAVALKMRISDHMLKKPEYAWKVYESFLNVFTFLLIFQIRNLPTLTQTHFGFTDKISKTHNFSPIGIKLFHVPHPVLLHNVMLYTNHYAFSRYYRTIKHVSLFCNIIIQVGYIL